MTNRAKNLIETIKLFKNQPVSFIFLRRETSYTPSELRAALDELIKAGELRQEATETGIIYKAVKK